MPGYTDVGWADAAVPPHAAAPPPAAVPPHREELRELPRGRHSGSQPAHPARPAGEAG
jgi:hypothetical protein